MYELYSIMFVSLILLITTKIYIGNKVLYFLGKNVFSIYILQRLSFISLQHLGIDKINIFLYLVLSIGFTLVLVFIFNKLLNIVYKIVNFSNVKKI